MNKALIVVSVGTTLAEADKRCILPIEEALQQAFPDRRVVRAYSSRMIRRKLQERGIRIESPEEASSRLFSEGYRDIIFASTHIIPGAEYDALLSSAGNFRVSEPLLVSEADLNRISDILASIADEEGRNILLMGHGSDHYADNIYSRLQDILDGKVFLACLKGERTFERLLPSLKALNEKKITLMPLMLVAGKHVQDELAASDTSWKTALESIGFDVRVRMQGLGELPAIRQIIVEKARRICN